jgi:hypothetical protein
MSRRDLEDNDPYVVIEQRSTSRCRSSSARAGAGAALLFARNPARRRAGPKRRAIRARKLPNESVQHRPVSETYRTRADASKRRSTARKTVDLKRRQVTRAVG